MSAILQLSYKKGLQKHHRHTNTQRVLTPCERVDERERGLTWRTVNDETKYTLRCFNIFPLSVSIFCETQKNEKNKQTKTKNKDHSLCVTELKMGIANNSKWYINTWTVTRYLLKSPVGGEQNKQSYIHDWTFWSHPVTDLNKFQHYMTPDDSRYSSV